MPQPQTHSKRTHGHFIPGEAAPIAPRKASGSSTDWFWGQGSFAQKSHSFLELAAESQVHVLIVGETGTGKEILAKRLHERRRELHQLTPEEAPFVAVNCGALPESLAESLLFGHERGAFTSARERQLGRFELARQGTLFLDEIQSLSLSCQVKLLRVIQNREFERLGSRSQAPVECQIVVASNVPLEMLVANKEFRQDLYYRINICPFFLPPLRLREEDFEGMVEGLLDKAARLLRRPKPTLHPDTRAALKKYSWPGNIRELEHALLYACLRSTQEIEAQALPPHLTGELSHYIEKGLWK